jgi:putative FmdB family regulatory protein
VPLYEYQCENCGEVFEVIQKFVDAPLTTHEKCGGAVHRLLSVSALQFKGSGWYVNDYAKASSKPPGNGGSGEKSDSSSKADSSKKEKPATSSSDAAKPSGKTES